MMDKVDLFNPLVDLDDLRLIMVSLSSTNHPAEGVGLAFLAMVPCSYSSVRT